MVIELEIVKTRISAPAHPSATGIGLVSGLVESRALDPIPCFVCPANSFSALKDFSITALLVLTCT